MVADHLSRVLELVGREIFEVARESLLERTGQNGQVARGGDLFVVGQSRSVAINRARHAERVGPARHHLGERVLVVADRLGDRHRHVVGRAGHDRSDGVLDADRVAGLDAELRRFLRRGVLGDRNPRLERHGALVELLEQQIERHHLGDRGGMPEPIFGDRIEGAPAVGVDHNGRERRGRRNGRGVMARPVRCVMRDMTVMRVMTSVPVMMGLSRGAGKGERRDRN